ncbi:hypothetical protein AB1Y20_013750 [Prymnesium parvum]|uniref:Uncharacterized protein n=1 Tax=Prymnesium parvum TaxID=97485 RepID=A0AB34IJ81_PRYPA
MDRDRTRHTHGLALPCALLRVLAAAQSQHFAQCFLAKINVPGDHAASQREECEAAARVPMPVELRLSLPGEEPRRTQKALGVTLDVVQERILAPLADSFGVNAKDVSPRIDDRVVLL